MPSAGVAAIVCGISDRPMIHRNQGNRRLTNSRDPDSGKRPRAGYLPSFGRFGRCIACRPYGILAAIRDLSRHREGADAFRASGLNLEEVEKVCSDNWRPAMRAVRA
jgi:hypothetical protein